MPVYNAAPYLRGTFDSLLGQSYQHFEIFAIDDGSSDESSEICDEYAGRDPRIHVSHLENQGSWSARNHGISQSTGKYLYFMDADDWVERDWLESLCFAASRVDADLVVSGFSMEYEADGGAVTFLKKLDSIDFATQANFRARVYSYLNESVMTLPWNKLFLRDRITNEDIRFENKKMPDHFFCIEYLRNAERVVFVPGGGYHWRRALASSNTQKDNKSLELFSTRLEHYQVMVEMYRHWGMEADAAAAAALSTFLVSRTVQCTQEVASNSSISFAQRVKTIERIIENPVVRQCASVASPDSRAISLMSLPIKYQHPRIALGMGLFEGFVRSRFPKSFYRLKERAVHGV